MKISRVCHMITRTQSSPQEPARRLHSRWNFLLTLKMSMYETFLFLTITAADGHKIHHWLWNWSKKNLKFKQCTDWCSYLSLLSVKKVRLIANFSPVSVGFFCQTKILVLFQFNERIHLHKETKRAALLGSFTPWTFYVQRPLSFSWKVQTSITTSLL